MPANPALESGFTLVEDEALKFRLNDIALSDDKDAARPVQVFYRHPAKTTEKRYPFITIELIDIVPAPDRQHSERTWYYANGTGLTPEQQASLTSLDYYPSEMDAAAVDAASPASGFLTTSQFTAVDILYQVETHCRTPLHDRKLTNIMLRRIFPLRGRGWLEIPQDGTMRRLELLDWRPQDILDVEAGYKKVIHRKVYTVKLNAEIPTSDFATTSRVLTVEGEIKGHNHPVTTEPPYLTEEF